MRIIVIGAGKVGYTLAEHLTQEEHDVTVIDKDDAVIERCSGSLDVICLKGNGANAKILLEAGVDKANIVIASTESDETNMLACLIAKRLGAGYTIARIRDPEFNESQTLLQNELGIDVAINPERATALEISRLLRYPFFISGALSVNRAEVIVAHNYTPYVNLFHGHVSPGVLSVNSVGSRLLSPNVIA